MTYTPKDYFLFLFACGFFTLAGWLVNDFVDWKYAPVPMMTAADQYEIGKGGP